MRARAVRARTSARSGRDRACRREEPQRGGHGAGGASNHLLVTGLDVAWADQPLAVNSIFEAVIDFACRALVHANLSNADRDDLAQGAATAAFRRWPTYRPEAGTPGQWLRGIVRNELRAFRRDQAKLPALSPDDVAGALSEDPDPEERTATIDLAYHLLSAVPAEQRRVVVLHELAELTHREIAKVVGISKSESHERHKDGMAALAAAAARLDERAPRRRRGFASRRRRDLDAVPGGALERLPHWR
jgi:RNA polymerase sigma factor (sigma-70 family)